MYVLVSENASIPNSSCGSWVVIFGVLFDNSQKFLYNLIRCLSNFLIVVYKKGTT